MQKTNFPLEIIIHDDASTDKTQKIIREYAAKDQRIKAILRETNIKSTGVPIFPITLQLARGKYIAICEGDDYWTDPYKLQKQVDFLEAHPDYVICYHNATIIDESGRLISHSKLPDNLKRDFSSHELKTGAWVLTLAMCFRNVINELPDVFFKLMCGDTFLVSVLGNYGKGKYLSNIQDAVYRKHPNSTFSSLSTIKRNYHSLGTYARLHRYYSILKDDKYALYFKNVVVTLFQSFIQRWSGLNDDNTFIIYFSKLLKYYRDILDEKTVRACTDHLKRGFYTLALSNYNQNNYNEAILYFRKIADLDPKDATVFNNLGVNYYKIGELDKAKENFAKALKLKPDYPEAQEGIEKICPGLVKWLDADSLRQAIVSETRRKDFSMEDKLKQGEALFAEGNIEEAEKYFSSLLENDPTNAEILNNLGVIHHTRGNVQEAEGYFLKALEAKEDYLDSLLNLADLYQNDKRWKEAALHLEKCIAIDDQAPNPFHQLGTVCLEMGDTEKARIALKKSLELNPDQETVRESLKELEKRDLAPNYLPTPGSFRGAFAEINITPNVSESNPIFLQGMGGPPRKAIAVSEPLMMQLLLLEDDHFTKVLFITADLFGFGPEIVDSVRLLTAQWGIEPEGLILNASHTHYALGTISHASKSIGPFYSEYAKQIVQTIGQQLPILYNGLEECELSWGKVKAQIGVSRRLKKDGKVVFAPNPEGYYDKDTPFLLLYMLKTDKKVLLVNHGCHPTGLGAENVISADYPGYLRNALKSNGGMDGVMFLQGGAGSTKESVPVNGGVQFCENSTAAKTNGEFLATQIIGGLKNGLQQIEGHFVCTRRQITLPLKPTPPPNVLAQVRNNEDTDVLVREWANIILNRFPNGDFPTRLDMEVQLVSVGDKVSFVALPGEPVAELARDLRRLTSNPDSTFVLGYTNGLIGYLPTDIMIEEGGYETGSSHFVYLAPSALNIGTESAVISSVKDCLTVAGDKSKANGYGRYHLAKQSRRAFFVLSAGRCGTLTLAHLLNTATNAHVWHHPQPDPIKKSLLAYLGEIDKRKAFWKARYPIIHKTWSEGLIHGETDLLMTPFCDMIAKEIPDSKFIILVRDPRDFVRSGMRRNYYYGHPWDFGRLRPQKGTEEFESWNKLDQFGKVCWLWNKTYEKTNLIINQIGRDRVVTVRFEDLVEGIEKTEELFNFLGLEGFNGENIKKLLSQRFNEQVTGSFPKLKDWSEKLNKTLWNSCGIIANHFGYQDTYEKKNSDSSISTNQQCLSPNTQNSEHPQFTGQNAKNGVTH